MPACPYAPHRLAFGEDLRCRHCGGDLRLYTNVRDLPIVFYNQARKLWDEGGCEEARGWLAAALALRPDLPEAHWLLGAVEARLGRLEPARAHLNRARELGAEIDPEAILDTATPRRHRRRKRPSRPVAQETQAG